MKVFLTGGGGFLGSYIVKLLIKAGHEVTNLSRGDYPELRKIGVKTIRGDITDRELLLEIMKGYDACFHVASKVAMWGHTKDFYQQNVTGTENIIESCKVNGIKYLIYTSTPSVVFGEESISGGNEKLPYPSKTFSRYAFSKSIAEKKVIEAASKELMTTSLRPHLIFGEGDKNLIPRLIESAKKGKLKIIGCGENQVDVIYVENAADAHLQALEQMIASPEEINGQCFFIGQGPIKLWPFINKILEKHQIAPIKKRVSFRMAFIVGAVIEGFLGLIRSYDIHPPMTRFVALQLSKDHYFSHEKAHQLLKWTPKVTIDEALSRI